MATIASKYKALSGRLDEATLRLWVAVEARQLGRGGVSTVAKAVGISRTTIYAGLAELDSTAPEPVVKAGSRQRVRNVGGGRKKLTAKDATLLRDLDALVDPCSRGDPMSPLRWTCKSTTRLAEELARRGHSVSQRSVCDLLAGVMKILNFHKQKLMLFLFLSLRQNTLCFSCSAGFPPAHPCTSPLPSSQAWQPMPL
jgi:molybdenum-dependent DNA-binding transcriptional regulator ModE